MRSQSLMYLLSSLLFAACAWTLATITWIIIGSTASSKGASYNTTDLPSPPPGIQVQHPRFNYITSLNLFGTPAIITPKKAERRKQISVSKLNIQLLGTITSEGASKAAIVSHRGSQRAYLIGENIPTKAGDVLIVDVLSDQMIISRQSTEEIVRLVKRRITSAPGIKRSASTGLTADLNSRGYLSLIGNAKNTLLKNPLTLSKFFSIQPVIEKGAMTGYQLKTGADSRLFQKLNLKANDVLTEVNGLHVSGLSLQDFTPLLQNNNALELTLLRDSVPVSFTVYF